MSCSLKQSSGSDSGLLPSRMSDTLVSTRSCRMVAIAAPAATRAAKASSQGSPQGREGSDPRLTVLDKGFYAIPRQDSAWSGTVCAPSNARARRDCASADTNGCSRRRAASTLVRYYCTDVHRFQCQPARLREVSRQKILHGAPASGLHRHACRAEARPSPAELCSHSPNLLLVTVTPAHALLAVRRRPCASGIEWTSAGTLYRCTALNLQPQIHTKTIWHGFDTACSSPS